LSKILTTALDRGYILKKPKIDKLKESQGRVRFLSDKEELSLLMMLQSIEYSDVADFVRCLIDTGCRVSELLRLTREDMNGDILTLWVTKNNQARSIPMTRRVKSILLRLTENQQMPFSNVDKSRIRSGWDRAKKMMGLENDRQFVPHCLRHTCASRLVQRGVPLTTVKEWLGHKSIQVTMRYSHLSPQSLIDAVKVLELAEHSTFDAKAAS
jgi:integrase